MNLAPILSVTGPFFRDIHHSQIQHFQETLIRRKHGFGFCDLPELAVKSLDGIRGIDQAANCFRIFEIGREIRLIVLPGFCDFRIFSAPFLIEAVQLSQCDLLGWSCIYTFQISHQGLEFLVRNKLCCIPDLMDNALLDLCLWKYSLDCLWETCQTVYTCDQDICHAAIL